MGADDSLTTTLTFWANPHLGGSDAFLSVATREKYKYVQELRNSRNLPSKKDKYFYSSMRFIIQQMCGIPQDAS